MFKEKKGGLTSEACQVSLNAVQDALYVLHGKWKLPIIIALSEGKKRFGEIQKTVKGIAPKVLSGELKALELNGFVVRHVYNEFPVLVEYELTEYSNTLEEVIKALEEGISFIENVNPEEAIVDDFNHVRAVKFKASDREIEIPAITISDYSYPHRATMQDTFSQLSAESLGQVGATLKTWLERGAPF